MTRVAFEYALIRVVPRVDRGESINAGVVVYSRPAQFLGGLVHLDRARLLAVDPSVDAAAIDALLASIAAICSSADDAALPGAEEIGRRFRWLTAPRSTVVQPGPVHTGLTTDVAAEPDRLLSLLVLPVV